MAPFTSLAADPLWTRDAPPEKTWPNAGAAPPAVSILQEAAVPDAAYTVIRGAPPAVSILQEAPVPDAAYTIRGAPRALPSRKHPPRAKRGGKGKERPEAARTEAPAPRAAPVARTALKRPSWLPRWPRGVSLLGLSGDGGGDGWSTSDTLLCAVAIAALCGLVAFCVGRRAAAPKLKEAVLPREPRALSGAAETYSVRDDIRALFDKAVRG